MSLEQTPQGVTRTTENDCSHSVEERVVSSCCNRNWSSRSRRNQRRKRFPGFVRRKWSKGRSSMNLDFFSTLLTMEGVLFFSLVLMTVPELSRWFFSWKWGSNHTEDARERDQHSVISWEENDSREILVLYFTSLVSKWTNLIDLLSLSTRLEMSLSVEFLLFFMGLTITAKARRSRLKDWYHHWSCLSRRPSLNFFLLWIWA